MANLDRYEITVDGDLMSVLVLESEEAKKLMQWLYDNRIFELDYLMVQKINDDFMEVKF